MILTAVLFSAPVFIGFIAALDGKDISNVSIEEDDLEAFNQSHPHDLKVTVESFNYLNISWMAPENNSNDIRNYIVYYFKANKTQSENCSVPGDHKSSLVDGVLTYRVIKGLNPGTVYGMCVQANFWNSTGYYSHQLNYITLGYGEDNPCNCTISKFVDHQRPCNQETGGCNCITKFHKGTQCDSCVDSYFMNRDKGCFQCHCDYPGSTGNCYLKDDSIKMCECKGEFYGRQCDMCKSGMFMNPTHKKCQPCHCNNNSVMDCNDKGVCKACDYNTTGNHCELCTDGYTGNALNRTCVINTIISSSTPWPQTQVSSFHEISVIMIICIAIAGVFVGLTILILYLFRRARGKPFRLWSIQLRGDRENVNFRPVIDQQPDLCLLSDEGVQYFERDDEISPSSGGRLQLNLPANQIYRNT